MKEAHAALLAAKPAEAPTTPASVAAIIEEQRAVDIQHDHALRSLFYLLLAASEHALSLDPPDEAGANGFQAASARLFPRGVDGTRATYLAEEGNAKLAAQAVKDDADLAALLASLELSKQKKASGTALFKAYVDLGVAVGDLERKKIAASGEATTTPATLLTARNAWIDLVGTVARVLSHAKGDAAKTLLRGVVEPAEKAQRSALAAAKRAKAKGATPPAGNGAPVVSPPACAAAAPAAPTGGAATGPGTPSTGQSD